MRSSFTAQRHKFLFLMPILGCCFLAACSTPSFETPTPTAQISVSTLVPGKYVFVEYTRVERVTSTGVGCRGNTYYDFPYYSFQNGLLSIEGGSGKIDLDTAMGLYGTALSATGNAGEGTYSYVSVISGFPYEPHFSDAPTINSVDGQGTVIVDKSGQSVALPAGQGWTKPLTSTMPRQDALAPQ